MVVASGDRAVGLDQHTVAASEDKVDKVRLPVHWRRSKLAVVVDE